MSHDVHQTADQIGDQQHMMLVAHDEAQLCSTTGVTAALPVSKHTTKQTRMFGRTPRQICVAT
jgi:hypothetical protein